MPKLIAFWRHRILGLPPYFPANTSAPVIGKWGESWAIWYYQRHRNAALLERNWRGEQGEIDLILQDKETLVFVEVKTRQPNDPSPLNEVLDSKRVERFQRVAREYFSSLPPLRPAVRFDVLIVLFDLHQQDTAPEIQLMMGVIQPVNFR